MVPQLQKSKRACFEFFLLFAFSVGPISASSADIELDRFAPFSEGSTPLFWAILGFRPAATEEEKAVYGQLLPLQRTYLIWQSEQKGANADRVYSLSSRVQQPVSLATQPGPGVQLQVSSVYQESPQGADAFSPQTWHGLEKWSLLVNDDSSLGWYLSEVGKRNGVSEHPFASRLMDKGVFSVDESTRKISGLVSRRSATGRQLPLPLFLPAELWPMSGGIDVVKAPDENGDYLKRPQFFYESYPAIRRVEISESRLDVPNEALTMKSYLQSERYEQSVYLNLDYKGRVRVSDLVKFASPFQKHLQRFDSHPEALVTEESIRALDINTLYVLERTEHVISGEIQGDHVGKEMSLNSLSPDWRKAQVDQLEKISTVEYYSAFGGLVFEYQKREVFEVNKVDEAQTDMQLVSSEPIFVSERFKRLVAQSPASR